MFQNHTFGLVEHVVTIPRRPVAVCTACSKYRNYQFLFLHSWYTLCFQSFLCKHKECLICDIWLINVSHFRMESTPLRVWMQSLRRASRYQSLRLIWRQALGRMWPYHGHRRRRTMYVCSWSCDSQRIRCSTFDVYQLFLYNAVFHSCMCVTRCCASKSKPQNI